MAQFQQQQPAAAPPADAGALARFLRPLLPGLTPGQTVYLAALFDLDGDGLVWPDDLVMAFEEIGTTIDTPASKLNAQAYKLLARVAGVVLGDYVEAFRAFARYSGRLYRIRNRNRNRPIRGSPAPSSKHPKKEDKEEAKEDKHGKEKKHKEKEKGKEKKDKGKKEEKKGERGRGGGGKDSDGGSSAKTVSSEGGSGRSSSSSSSSSSDRSSNSSDDDESGELVEVDLSELQDVQLTQQQLARFLSHLTNHSASPSDIGALVVYLNVKLAAADGPAAAAAPAVRPGPNQPYGNPYGSPQPYHRLRESPPTFDWAFLVGLFRGAETSLPVDRRVASPPGSRRATREETERAGHGAVRAVAKAAAEAAEAAARRDAEEAEEARAAAEEEAEAWGRGLGRSAPLRSNALTLPPAPHPDRRIVDLTFHVHADGRTFLLDPVTGLLYIASPYILAAADAVAEAAGAPPPRGRGAAAPPAVSPRLLGGGGGAAVGSRASGGGAFYSPSAGGGAAGGHSAPSPPPPPLLLPYPDLAGKLQYPDNRLLPAQSGSGVGLVCRALERLVAEEPRASALYKVLDRDGHGLHPTRLHQLISDAASLTAAEVAFAVALLDRRGRGRVTMAELKEAAQTVHYTATALAGGASPSLSYSAAAAASPSGPAPAPPVTLSLTRVEARALDVLHRGGQALQREARLWWLRVAKAGAAGTGQLDRAAAEALLREVLQPYLPPHEIRVVLSYLAMMTPDTYGNTTADEVVQLLRALPMRLRLPYSDVMGAGAASAAAEIIFAAGFGGPVAADGTLPPIQPSVATGSGAAAGGGGVSSPYNRKLRQPTGPTDAEPELLYGPNDGAVLPDPNLPYDPYYGDGPYGREAEAAAREPRRARLPQSFFDRPSAPPAAAADRQRAQEAAGQYGLYDDTQPDDMYDDSGPSPRPRRSPLPPPPAAAATWAPRRPGGAAADPFAPESQSQTSAGRKKALASASPAGQATGVSMSLQEEADLLDQLRGRPTRKLAPGAGGGGGSGGAGAAGYDTGTQYGLMSDLAPPTSAAQSFATLKRGSPAQMASRRASGDDAFGAGGGSGFDAPVVPSLPVGLSQRLADRPVGQSPRLPDMPFVGPSPRLPGMSPRLPERPMGQSPRLRESADSGGRGGDVYDSYISERPSTLRTSPAVGGGQPAEVLSFLDGGSSSGGAASSSDGGGGGGGRRRPPAVADSQLMGAAGGGGTFDPYGMHDNDDDMVNAGSVPPSRPMTAATLPRGSVADMPRLASPALDTLMGSSRGGSRLVSEPSAGADVDDGGGEYDPYSDELGGGGSAEPAPLLGRRPSGRLSAARLSEPEAAAAVSSASGPALFTSFGDAFRDGSDGGGRAAAAASSRHGSGGSGGSGSDGSAGGPSLASSMLPPPSFRTTAPPPPPLARSRLAKSSTRPSISEEEYDDDPYAEDDSAAGAAKLTTALVTSPQAGGGSGRSASGDGAGGGGGGSMFNTSIRSQTGNSPLGMSIRSGGAADRYGSPGRGAGGGGGGAGGGDSSSASSNARSGGGSGRSGSYGLEVEEQDRAGAERRRHGGGHDDEGYGSHGDGDGDDAAAGSLDYDETELAAGDGEEFDPGLEEDGGDDF